MTVSPAVEVGAARPPGAFDVIGSFRDAAELPGCSHHTLASRVVKREADQLPIAGKSQRRDRKARTDVVFR